MGAHHVEHGHKLSNYEASFLPLYHTKRGYMGIGEGWIYSKSFLCTKQAAFCSLFMPVIIKICVFSFVYSASLVETTCGLFPIFRWSGVPTRAARTQYWNWPFFLGRQPANTACSSHVDLLFSIYMEIIKSINGTGRIPETLRSWDFFQSWDWQHSSLATFFLA